MRVRASAFTIWRGQQRRRSAMSTGERSPQRAQQRVPSARRRALAFARRASLSRVAMMRVSRFRLDAKQQSRVTASTGAAQHTAVESHAAAQRKQRVRVCSIFTAGFVSQRACTGSVLSR